MKLVATGKVRESYEDPSDPTRLILVASDRVSAFDHVFSQGVPGKGRLLTAISAAVFRHLEGTFPTHFLGLADGGRPEFAGRGLLVKRADMIPVECVVRGYLVGSAWDAYQKHGTVHGVRMPAGLGFGARLPRPIFTPTTKAHVGHDLPLDEGGLESLVGRELATRLRETSTGIFEELSSWYASKGLNIVDTKFEFGMVGGRLTLADEVGTPDSSRIVAGSAAAPDAWLDKQILRDWLVARGYRGDGPAPALDGSVLEQLRSAYVEVYQALTGDSFANWPGSGELYLGKDDDAV